MKKDDMPIATPDQPSDAPKAVFSTNPKLDRTYTPEHDIYLEGHEVTAKDGKVKYKKVILETLHGVKQSVHVRLLEMDDLIYER